MEKHYAETHYVQDLEALIKDHELQLLDLSAEQQASQGFESKIKEDCDSFAKDIKKIEAEENFESDQTLQQQRKELSEKLIFSWQKLKWFRKQQSVKLKKRKNCRGTASPLYTHFHMNVIHDK